MSKTSGLTALMLTERQLGGSQTGGKLHRPGMHCLDLLLLPATNGNGLLGTLLFAEYMLIRWGSQSVSNTIVAKGLQGVLW